VNTGAQPLFLPFLYDEVVRIASVAVFKHAVPITELPSVFTRLQYPNAL
jgi:hypothetical protein